MRQSLVRLGGSRLDIKADRLIMDRLSPIIARFSLTAKVFYAGVPCGSYDFQAAEGGSYLHVLRSGCVTIQHPDGKSIALSEPSVVFYPRPRTHRFLVDQASATELVCATVDFGAGLGNPLLNALPELIVIPLASLVGLIPVTTLFFDEAFNARCGRQAAVDRLAECFLILLLRHAIENQLVSGGILSGLADTRLVKAITAMHERPEHDWTVEKLACEAGMSRARFAAHFRATVHSSPLEYLTEWRISVAQTLLKRGKPMKWVAPAVGYADVAALARVFKKRTGMTPTRWQRRTVRRYQDEALAG